MAQIYLEKMQPSLLLILWLNKKTDYRDINYPQIHSMFIQQSRQLSLAMIAVSAISFIASTFPAIATPILADRFTDPTRIQSVPRGQLVTRNISISGEIREGGNLGGTQIACNRLKVSFQENLLSNNGNGLRQKILGTGNASGNNLGVGSSCLYSLNVSQPLTSLAVAQQRVFVVQVESDTYEGKYLIKGSTLHLVQGHLPDTLQLQIVGSRHMSN